MPANEEYWRRPSKMHVIFAISSLVLLLATISMLVKDYDDEWRVYQREFSQLDANRSKELEQELVDSKYREQEAALKKASETAADDLEKLQGETDPLNTEIAKLSAEFVSLSREVKFKRAERDKARADFDLSVRDEHPAGVRDRLKGVFDNIQNEVLEMESALQKLSAELNDKKAKMAELTSVHDEAADLLAKHSEDLNRIRSDRLAKEPEDLLPKMKRLLVNTPLLDLNPTYKINQIWLPDLTINLGGLKDVARFDRCITCHQATDRVGAGNVAEFPPDKYEHPFQTHPRTDLFLTASSPHPQAKFGCTICHHGQGSGTSFQNASHSPNNPVVDENWKEEYGYAHNHFWEEPMFPDRFKESTCLKCHHDVVELGVHPKFGASAPKVFKGAELVRKYGCFGCHEIRGFDGTDPIGPDFRLEPTTPEQAAKIAADPNAIAGKMRKVGPSLRHFASKATAGWAEVWIEEPKSFRPETRMPQFFHLSNQQDEQAKRFSPVEIASTVTYLRSHSESLEMLKPVDGYKPNAERGKEAFARRCLNCHDHADFPDSHDEFGPDLSKVNLKLLPGQEGFTWLYTWIREPKRYHPRTKMPNFFLKPETAQGETTDLAADIAAYLLKDGPHQYGSVEWDEKALDDLVLLFLGKTITPAAAAESLEKNKLPAKYSAENIKGDEVELLGDKITKQMKLNYVGRRTISRYGCYACHDIPGFENARPIGTALQDWGRKDTSKLAFEHIGEYLHHFGEADGSSTAHRAELAIRNEENESFPQEQDPQRELSVSYFFDQLMHHGRPGFAWQKLRAPRSYDFRKIETKGYDERLRMPKFPFNEEEAEAVVTFLLGLTANPPAPQYVYNPTGPAKDRIEGERLLRKFNCTGCHSVELPEIRYWANPEDLLASDTSTHFPAAVDLLLKLKPPQKAATGRTKHIEATEDEDALDLSEFSFHGVLLQAPDPDDDPVDQEYSYQSWDVLKVGDKTLFPGEPILVPAARWISADQGRGGRFARWLTGHLLAGNRELNLSLASQMGPPPLYQEGIKVQTPWLYKFLRNPEQLRFTTVLRMPKFNMSDEEAQSLANYFAAVDGAEYPYQDIPQREPDYLAAKEAAHANYLEDAWNLFTVPAPEGLCVKCHQYGGMVYQSKDPKDVRGPNLNRVAQRLQPDWLMLWLYYPPWITPYTSMPQNFKPGEAKFPTFFSGDGDQQTQAIRDALLNYHRMMEEKQNLAGSRQPAGQAGGQ